MLSNAYFLAKIRFDTAENEPAKNLQHFANFPNFANFHPCPCRSVGAAATARHRAPGRCKDRAVQEGGLEQQMPLENGHLLFEDVASDPNDLCSLCSRSADGVLITK